MSEPENAPVVEPIQEASSDQSVVDRILSRAKEGQPVPPQVAEVGAGNCFNCHVQGSGEVKLKDGVCPKCGYAAPRN